MEPIIVYSDALQLYQLGKRLGCRIILSVEFKEDYYFKYEVSLTALWPNDERFVSEPFCHPVFDTCLAHCQNELNDYIDANPRPVTN